MIWLLYTSLKTDREIFLAPFTLPQWDGLQWVNFSSAWTLGHFGDFFLNSTIITIVTVALSLLFAVMAAYALADTCFAADDMDGAAQAARGMLKAGQRSGRLLMAVPALCDLAGIAQVQGKLRQAEQFFDQAHRWMAERRGHCSER